MPKHCVGCRHYKANEDGKNARCISPDVLKAWNRPALPKTEALAILHAEDLCNRDGAYEFFEPKEEGK